MSDISAAFIEASLWHGPLEPALEILASHPDIADSDIYAAAVLGDNVAVSGFLKADPAAASAKGGPRDWDALTYLCFSKFLRADSARTNDFVRAATSLLDAGASANTGFWEKRPEHEPEWESAIYGAAGVAFNPELTKLLLERGADPNDEETPYHAPETYDNRTLHVLVESGKINDDSLATMLLRKHDWHDFDGIKWLLEHGADPNRETRWRATALHHAVLRDNSIEIFELLLNHGADPTKVANGKSAIAIAARRGRRDLLELFQRRGIPLGLHGVEELIAACALNDETSMHAIVARDPNLVSEIRADGGKLLLEFAGVGNTDGVRNLIGLGVDVGARFKERDVYWDVTNDSTALHIAAWRGRHPTVKLLIERGAPVEITDGKGRTPLALAVRACVDSYWTDRRSPESVEALLRAGAQVKSVDFPSGYDEVDALLDKYARASTS